MESSPNFHQGLASVIIRALSLRRLRLRGMSRFRGAGTHCGREEL